MIVQGVCEYPPHLSGDDMSLITYIIAPMFWGTLSDRWGRRPMFLACMLVLTLACVGLALTPTDAYWLLMLLRCLQAAGSASTVALGAYKRNCPGRHVMTRALQVQVWLPISLLLTSEACSMAFGILALWRVPCYCDHRFAV